MERKANTVWCSKRNVFDEIYTSIIEILPLIPINMVLILFVFEFRNDKVHRSPVVMEILCIEIFETQGLWGMCPAAVEIQLFRLVLIESLKKQCVRNFELQIQNK